MESVVSALRCFDVSKTYPINKHVKVWAILLGEPVVGQVINALQGISLDVPKGKILGVLGKNGAGKSTLLRVLGGVYPPTTGRVVANGQIAGLFELGGMSNPNLTGREYATRYLRIMGAPHTAIQGLLDDILAFSELDEAFDHRVRTYSSGMGARLYFAAATAMQHEIYLIDELLSVGDEHFQAKCWTRMRERLLTGASGILVTHDWAAVLRLCEKANVIERGRFVFEGQSDQAVVSYLNLPVVTPTVARFSENCKQHYIAQSGENTTFKFDVVVCESASVDFSVSIEMLRIGIGWEIVLLSDFIAVCDDIGTYVVTVDIPDLPLLPGSFSLNVFLSRRKDGSLAAATGLDSRSWTLGNGFSLEVEGQSMSAAVKLPFIASRAQAAL